MLAGALEDRSSLITSAADRLRSCVGQLYDAVVYGVNAACESNTRWYGTLLEVPTDLSSATEVFTPPRSALWWIRPADKLLSCTAGD